MFKVGEKDNEIKIPIIFPDYLVHRQIAGAIKPWLCNQFGKVELASA
jgi:hypothetical protein